MLNASRPSLVGIYHYELLKQILLLWRFVLSLLSMINAGLFPDFLSIDLNDKL